MDAKSGYRLEAMFKRADDGWWRFNGHSYLFVSQSDVCRALSVHTNVICSTLLHKKTFVEIIPMIFYKLINYRNFIAVYSLFG